MIGSWTIYRICMKMKLTDKVLDGCQVIVIPDETFGKLLETLIKDPAYLEWLDSLEEDDGQDPEVPEEV